jgi:hypothetical protein
VAIAANLNSSVIDSFGIDTATASLGLVEETAGSGSGVSTELATTFPDGPVRRG